MQCNVIDGEHQRIKEIPTYLSELRPDGTYGEVVSRTWKRRAPPLPTSSTAPAPKKMQFGDNNDLLVVQKVLTQRKRGAVTPTLKNVACKSTTKQSVDYGFSFYGVKPDYGDLTKITTTFTINSADVTRSVEQFSHIFNLYPNVVLEDCMKNNRNVDI